MNYSNLFGLNLNYYEGNIARCSKITNIERHIFSQYLYLEEKEFNIKKEEINNKSIMENIEIAITAYSKYKEKYKNICLSKFVLVEPKIYNDIIKEEKPFLIFGYKNYDISYLNEYEKINKLYKYNFLYSIIMTRSYIPKIHNKYIEDFIEYNLIEASLISANYIALKSLLDIYKENKKCYKLLDFENEVYLEDNEINIELNEEDLMKRIKLDISKYKYECYI